MKPAPGAPGTPQKASPGAALCTTGRTHCPGPTRSQPPLVAITRAGGYGANASAINSSEINGPYESAVSMRFTSSSTARRNVASAASRSGGGPQIPLPVMRIAPNPRRLTVQSPS